MHLRKKISFFTAALVFLGLLVVGPHASADTWDGGINVWIVYQEMGGVDSGHASVVLTANIPRGTPLLARETVLESALRALRDIWKAESVHEDVRGFLGPDIPMDIQRAVTDLRGAPFIIALMDAFDQVGDAGFSRFQSDVSVSASERIPLMMPAAMMVAYPDAPRSYEWVAGGGPLAENNNHETWVIASLVNYSAAVLGFRSEFGRFPTSLAELREGGHLLIEPLNPYTNFLVQGVDSASPGNVSYEYINPNTVVIRTYITIDGEIEVVRRQIDLYPTAGSFNLLYRETAGLSDNDKQVARYVFQISQILNEYYYQYNDLPYRVPQCEAEGFAYVSFHNPYTGRDAMQADSLVANIPGDYRYNRLSSTEYFLVGYGEGGGLILGVGKNFSESEVSMGTLGVQ